jgi:hypothetical protein
LKDKARIKVNNSCVLIGVVDAKGILEEGEVFIQIDQQEYNTDYTGAKSKQIKKILKSQAGMEGRNEKPMFAPR